MPSTVQGPVSPSGGLPLDTNYTEACIQELMHHVPGWGSFTSNKQAVTEKTQAPTGSYESIHVYGNWLCQLPRIIAICTHCNTQDNFVLIVFVFPAVGTCTCAGQWLSTKH